ncbi:sugar isomerase domain-containing protein [Pontibacillus sp. HMF3514]|uniref:sugar isomerase domain-containing protein n=1 Tax=Pontibacillus sp. HMF3514 TaxID=2692425 RepID=UPI00131FC906|nr:SIS domain-containing protein [Pontibacillus sp. HMF3514]QHE53929.1 sugar isomerase domain-containing protein [Pontibacillus sp. HMF3514]
MSYLSTVSKMLQELETSTQNDVEEVSDQMVKVISDGGIIHLFGCGHSNLIAQDAFYRAGGLAPVRAINLEPFMLHKGAEQASENERKSNMLEDSFQHEDIRETDALIVISTSGRNPVPIDAALYGKEKGAFIVGLLSKEYKNNQASKHPSGYRLEDVVDHTLETNVPVGDAVMSHDNIDESFSPVSSVIATALLQEVFSKTIIKLKEKGIDPPILKSGNVDSSDSTNKTLLNQYRHRILY